MGACPSRNKNSTSSNSQQATGRQYRKPEKLFFANGSFYEGGMMFSEKDGCWIQHGNGIYICQDGTKLIANFYHGDFNFEKSSQVDYYGSGRKYSGRMSMLEGEPSPNGKGQLTETKQGATEKQAGEFRKGVLYNGTLTLDKEGLCISIEVREGRLVLRKDPKDDVPKKQSWADALEEEWEYQRKTRGYSNQDVWVADKNAEELIAEEATPSAELKQPRNNTGRVMRTK